LIAVVGLIETLIFSKIVAYPFGNGG
jgi:hypothetical protein